MKNRKIVAIFLILTIIFTLSGGTLAYLNWRSSNSQQTNVTFNLPANFADYIDVKGDATFVGDLNISDSYLNGIHSTVTISKKEYLKDVNVYATLYLKINEIGDNIKKSSALKWVVTSGNSTNPGSILKQGNFYGKNKDDIISLLYYQEVTLEVQEYTIWIYLDANENPSSNLSGETLDVDVLTEIDNKAITAKTLVNKANPESLLYADATDVQKKEMWAFSHEATEQVGATTDYRYIGSSPNNYITFNDETWRIIGVFDGRIKIIRQDSLGDMARDNKQSGVGSSTSSYGSNDWSDSQLMYMLNNNWLTTGSDILKSGYAFDGTYVKDSNGKIIYQKGCIPTETDGTTYSCSSNTWSLNDRALTQIDKVTYYLGGSNSDSHSGISYYAFERGTTVYGTNPTNWNGYVGLAYPSDYIYTFANGVDETCFSNGGNCYTSNGAVPTSSWMKVMYGSNTQWLISSSSGLAYIGFYVYSTGNGYSSNSVFDSGGVRPTVYLSSGIKLEGKGTSSNHYQIQ